MDEDAEFAAHLRMAERGEPNAQVYVGVRYELGGSTALAVGWYGRAKMLGHKHATEHLKHRSALKLSDSDERDSTVDLVLADFSRAADEAKCALAQYALGLLYFTRDRSLARNKLTQSAEQGLAPAQHALSALLDSKDDEKDRLREMTGWLEKAATQGFASSAYELHVLASRKDHIAARKWLRQSADGGYPRAMATLAEQFEKELSPSEALTWWRRLADDHDSPRAMYEVGLRLSKAPSESPPSKETVEWWRRCAESQVRVIRGDGEARILACTALGRFHASRGESKKADSMFLSAAEAGGGHELYEYSLFLNRWGSPAAEMRFIQRAAETGYAPAEFALACAHLRRRIPFNWEEALRLFLKSSTDANSHELYEATNHAKDIGFINSEQVFTLYDLAAKHGNAASQYKIGSKYKSENKIGLAFENYALSAKGESVDGMFELGLAHDFGFDGHVPINPQEALKWYQRAGETGHAGALYNAGLLLLFGGGTATSLSQVEPDKKAADELFTRAFEEYKRAADRGDLAAAFEIGRMCEAGRGTPKDLTAAITWYYKARSSAGQTGRDATEAHQRLNRALAQSEQECQ